ncbi:uncharacterized protein LOC112454325 [Temnothorax curvispinosus]|uniref:Uncharacterized protein LOC112454325 n=1 Tax=Temnothorax curvispinosus TaxID=300111 RepID=A0A6J1PQS6_9HYME|nr:uncharacterized protein LOC112454325 [Temnothorax curvispinosus]
MTIVIPAAEKLQRNARHGEKDRRKEEIESTDTMSRRGMPQVTKGTLIRELREDIRMEIDPRRKPQITQQLVYRVADRMAASGSFIGKSAHARNITPFPAFLSVITL